jgi:hypothetical protein
MKTIEEFLEKIKETSDLLIKKAGASENLSRMEITQLQTYIELVEDIKKANDILNHQKARLWKEVFRDLRPYMEIMLRNCSPSIFLLREHLINSCANKDDLMKLDLYFLNGELYQLNFGKGS